MSANLGGTDVRTPLLQIFAEQLKPGIPRQVCVHVCLFSCVRACVCVIYILHAGADLLRAAQAVRVFKFVCVRVCANVLM